MISHRLKASCKREAKHQCLDPVLELQTKRIRQKLGLRGSTARLVATLCFGERR